MDDVTICVLTEADWPEVRRIFAEGIATGHATFESEPPSWERFDQGKVEHSRLVAVDADGRVLGSVAASRVSSRAVYAGAVEHSVYVADSARGRGVGRALLEAFILSTEVQGVWTIQASIFPENTSTIGLHAALGFRTIGRRERIAKMTYGPLAGQWRDTLLLERRSAMNPGE
jgi:L-amino acid N-acyltransferase YncA